MTLGEDTVQLVSRLAAKINIDLWPGDVEAIYAEFARLLTPEAIKESLAFIREIGKDLR